MNILYLLILLIVISYVYSYSPIKQNNKKIVTVFCSSKNDIDEKYKIKSKELIELLNPNKIILAYGGNTGIMKTVYDTYKKKDGQIISVNYKKFAKTYNDYVYDTLEERQNKLVDLGDEYIILPGGLGTTYELFQILVKNNIKDFRKKIYILNMYGFFDDLIKYIVKLNENKFISNGIESMNIYISNNPIKIANKINNKI